MRSKVGNTIYINLVFKYDLTRSPSPGTMSIKLKSKGCDLKSFPCNPCERIESSHGGQGKWYETLGFLMGEQYMVCSAAFNALAAALHTVGSQYA